eukprot:6308399-Pyramimonas_sp.AAC.1
MLPCFRFQYSPSCACAVANARRARLAASCRRSSSMRSVVVRTASPKTRVSFASTLPSWMR